MLHRRAGVARLRLRRRKPTKLGEGPKDMYEAICRLLAQNGARLVYTTSRPTGATLKALAGEYPALRGQVSINEKVAFELALTGAIASKKTACIFTTDGFYKALDPVMTSAYTGVARGFLVICVREIDEDITPLGPFSKLPIMTAGSQESLARAVSYAYDASERHQIPFIIQVSPEAATRVPAADRDENLHHPDMEKAREPAQFLKDPGRWAALPKSRYRLHGELNGKIERIRAEFESYGGNTAVIKGRTGVITDRAPYPDLSAEDVSILHLETVFPLPTGKVDAFLEGMDRVTVSEGTCPVIGLQLRDRSKVETVPVAPEYRRPKGEETMFGFHVVRDKLGPASSINLAHGMVKRNPGKKVMAITYEDHFFHSGLPAFVNTIYNRSVYLLLIMTHEREAEIKAMLTRWGFADCHIISGPPDIEHFREVDTFTTLLCRGII